MAAANAVLDVILADGFLEEVDRVSRIFWRRLVKLVADYPTVFEEARGAGLMLGLKCVVNNGEMQGRLRDAGLLTVAAGDNVVRLLPPLIINEADIDAAMTMLEKVARSWFH
jgi:acetylornithine/N-succinyldiaminopimelate aminotransferase